MKKILFVVAFLFLICMPLATAENITLSVEQTEYFFLTGEQAIVPLTMNNTYGKEIDGVMKYTLTQEVQQGGSWYSSTNSQSQSFSVPKGNQTINLNFGRSDEPLTLRVDLLFSYHEGGEDYLVSLGGISIYFVSNQSQMNNQQNPKQSSSEKTTNAEPSNNNQQQQPQTPQQKLQNNQMSQDSQALKDQIQQQVKEEQEQQDAFEQSLFNNSEFQQYHQDLMNQGYNISSKQLDAESNDTGSFNFSYENQNGETASLQGEMEDGELQNVQKQTAEDREEMFETLNQSKQFQEYAEKLGQEGFNQTSVSFHQNGNSTTMELKYENKENKTATITAEFLDKELQDVRLSKQDQTNPLFWILPLVIFLLFIVLYVYYRYQKKHQNTESTSKETVVKPFDYKKEAKRLLSEAEHLYKNKKYKDAYGKAGQSLRLYLSYEHGLQKELTNEEVIRFLKTKKYPYKQIKQCFDLCSLVEFAKYTTNKNDFYRVQSTVGKIITG